MIDEWLNKKYLILIHPLPLSISIISTDTGDTTGDVQQQVEQSPN
jgi:hypothetical protein